MTKGSLFGGHQSYVSKCTWDETHVYCVPGKVCYPVGNDSKTLLEVVALKRLKY